MTSLSLNTSPADEQKPNGNKLESTSLVREQAITHPYGLNMDDSTKPGLENESGSTTLNEDKDPKNGANSEDTPDTPDKETCSQMCFRLFCFPMTLPLLFIKLFYFSFIGALGCILPFLSIYYKQQGLTPQQIGLISGLRPVVGFTSGPLWGAIADRYNIRKIMLLISILAWVGAFVGLAFVPSPEILDECPEDIHPHRNVIKFKHEPSDEYYTLTTANSTENVTEEEYDILRESIGWIYVEEDVTRIFLIILVLILLGEFFQSPTTALSDAGTIQELGMENLDYYGAQRAWGPVGWAVCSLAVGAMVAATREMHNVCGVELYFSDYFHFVYIFVGFMFFAFIFATQINFKEDNNGKNKSDEKIELTTKVDGSDEKKQSDTKAVWSMFLNMHYGSWIATAFFVGICNGIIWGFLFWHLDNLGADQLMIGIASVVTCTSEFFMFFFVGPIIKHIGHINIMYSGLFLYSVRFVIYGSITNPWWVLPAEFLQGVTFSCIWVSLTSYSALSVPANSLATIQGILHGVYFGLGNGTGHLIGGIVIGYAGAPVTFYSMAIACIITMGLFFVAQKVSTKPELNYEQLK